MVKQRSGTSSEPMSAAGLLGWLYDMSFTRHYAAQVIKAVYWLVTAFYSLVAVVAIVRLIQDGTALEAAVGALLIIVAYVLTLVVARIALEVLIVIFRIGEDLSAIRTTGVPSAGSPAYSTTQPYFMPIPAASPRPATPPAPVPPMASWPAQPERSGSLGPYLEETVGYGNEVETPTGTTAEGDEPSPPSGEGGTAGEIGYPPEADGPPWIT